LALHGRILYEVHAIEGLAPFIVPVVVAALLLAWKRKDQGALVPLAVVGGGLAFDMLSLADNSIQPFLRYFITAIPMEVLLIGALVATRPFPLLLGGDRSPPLGRRSGSTKNMAAQLFAVVLCICVAAPSLVTTGRVMFNPTIGSEESRFLGFIFHNPLNPTDKTFKQEYPAELMMSAYFSKLHLPHGSIVVDNFSACVPGLITVSGDPKIFVIPNDQDFQRILADPLTFHARYILEADPQGLNSLTAVATTYPTLWQTGAGFAKDVHQFTFRDGGCGVLRLFRVFTHPTEAGSTG
jgi:hypothetical protein